MTTSAAMALRRLARRAFARADALCDRLYGWRGNPLYQTGSLALLALAIVLATGIYLLLFYRIGDPYGSVARLQAQAWGGRWIRALHRYASDVAVAAALLHALRMFAQGRSFGPRALAWLSGLGLAALVFVCGWTGLVMVWDESARVIAVEGARLLDALPLFSEPLARTFSGERELPAAFFFLNLFAHIAVPIAVALVLWLHVSRLARPVLLPPRQLTLVATALLVAAAIAMPAPLAAEADPLRIPGSIPFDLFYALWVPLFAQLAPGTSWLWIAIAVAAPLLAPWWTRPRAAQRPRPSVGNEELCTGCLQCERDCPFAAIAMVPRGGDLADVFARVNPERCVSCGICAGSCAPMVIGPPDRGGRDQLAAARAFAAEHRLTPHDVVLVACANGAGGLAAERAPAGAPVWPVGCSGNLHSSVVEALLRGGAGGVLVAACPPRDCANREGSKWLEERLFAGREAELAERVDRRRVRVVFAGAGRRDEVLRALAALRVEVAALGRERRSDEDATGPECESSRARLAS